jgi:hypothetical protein
MSFGSSAQGSSAYGGNANAVNEQVFFILDNRAPDVLYEAQANFNGPETFYEILTLQGSESGSGPSGIEYKVYTSDGPGITPQLQVTIGGNGQSIIGAAPIIVVTAIIDSAVWAVGTDFSVRGRPYTQ